LFNGIQQKFLDTAVDKFNQIEKIAIRNEIIELSAYTYIYAISI